MEIKIEIPEFTHDVEPTGMPTSQHICTIQYSVWSWDTRTLSADEADDLRENIEMAVRGFNHLLEEQYPVKVQR